MVTNRVVAWVIPGENSKGYREIKHYYVYIMTNRSNGLYTGVTNNLQRRVYEHKLHLVTGFTSRYQMIYLVYFEETPDVYAAITREKQIKSWGRVKKIALIESVNSDWRDLSEDWQEA
jgi:putative endonuclease